MLNRTPEMLKLFFSQLIRAGVRVIASINGETAESAYWEVPFAQRSYEIDVLNEIPLDQRRLS